MPGGLKRAPRRGVRRRFSASATPDGPPPVHVVSDAALPRTFLVSETLRHRAESCESRMMRVLK